MISIFVPAYNEEKILEENILRLHNFLKKNIRDYKIIILDSSSKDKTPEISKRINKKFKKILYLNNEKRGKGIAIKEASLKMNSDFYSFIDIDMPINLEEYVRIIKKVIDGETDICIASKYVRGSVYNRPLKRVVASKAYNLISRIFLGLPIRDVFVGVKAWNKKVNCVVWPDVKDERWFFDMEFLYHSDKKGFKILEMPVTYKETRADSRLSFSKEGVYLGRKLFKLIFNNILT